MDDMNGDSPDLHIACVVQLERWVIRMGGFQPKSALMSCESLQRERPIQHCHDDAPRPWIEAAIHDQQISIVNASVCH